MAKHKLKGEAEVITKEDGTSVIVVTIGSFKDRRSAQRKLTDLLKRANK